MAVGLAALFDTVRILADATERSMNMAVILGLLDDYQYSSQTIDRLDANDR